MYYNDFYEPDIITNAATTSNVDYTWLIVSVVLAIVGGIVAYVMFVSKKNKNEYTGFIKWLHDFLNFKNFFIEMVLKVLYIMSAIFITLSSFSFISTSVAAFFMYLILGNIIVRILFETTLMFLTLVKNTSEINDKLGISKKVVEKPTVKPEKKNEKKVNQIVEDTNDEELEEESEEN